MGSLPSDHYELGELIDRLESAAQELRDAVWLLDEGSVKSSVVDLANQVDAVAGRVER